jgi:hypothetical protein
MTDSTGAAFTGGELGGVGTAWIATFTSQVGSAAVAPPWRVQWPGYPGGMIKQALDQAAADKASAAGLPLVAYESGQTLVDYYHQHGALEILYQTANHDSRMGTAYLTYFNGWKALGGGMINNFADISQDSTYGYWGALNNVWQTSSPKYNALLSYINETSTIPPPASAPTTTLTASPTSVTSGQSSTLSWSSTNATACTGVNFSPSGTSGSISVAPSVATTYSLSCTGTGGSTSASATVTVAASSGSGGGGVTTLSSGLIGYWPFNEGSGATTADASGNGYTGTLSNPSPQWVAGRYGDALNFASGGDVTLSTAGTVSGSFTVSAWVNMQSMTTPSMVLITTRQPSDHGFDIQVNATGLHGDIGDGTSWLTTSADANTASLVGGWHFITYVVTPSGYSIYLDGASVGSGSFSGTPLVIDANHTPLVGYAFLGSIDDLRIYDRALSASEIAALAAGQLSQAQSPDIWN